MTAGDPLHRVLPLPQLFELRDGSLPISARTRIVTGAGIDEHDHTASHLVADVQRATGLHLGRAQEAGPGDILLQLDSGAAAHGPEGYALDVDQDGAVVRAATAHGLWNGTRTLVQLLPHDPLEARLPWVHIVDQPRFEWRGVMLDVARHFFGVDQVLRFIELIARFKLNRLHLHLTDDQGWRLAIDDFGTLTRIGGSSRAGGGHDGGYSSGAYT